MIECIFTLDYEIFGNGTGGLKDLVYEPAERLRDLFTKRHLRFVNFVEVAEFEKIDACNTDRAIDLVRKQIKELYQMGFEIGLHLHPQWCNARYEQGQWVLDASEYNLCTLPRTRIVEIVQRSLAYMRHMVDDSAYTPLSFRAGNWLFQPTQTAAGVLAENGVRLDSSVFKGGVQRNHRLDYRTAPKNNYYWSFECDVNEPDASGRWIEVPIYTKMVPIWEMPTSKRMSFGNSFGMASQGVRRKLSRALDFLRFRYPMKLDFCRMTIKELTSMMDRVMRDDRNDPTSYKPVVAIGHTKDLIDLDTVETFLSYLQTNKIGVATFESAYSSLSNNQNLAVCSSQSA